MKRLFRSRKVDRLDARDLVERSLQYTGLPTAALIQKSRDAFADPVTLTELDRQYKNLAQEPAWQHFMGRLAEMQQAYQEAILRGERDRFGNDLTDKARASLGTLLQVMAVPGQVSQARKQMETVLLGPGLRDELDTELTHTNI